MADNRENDRQMPPEAIPIRDHFRPVINTHYSGIARGTINANNFELKPALINMVQQNQFGEPLLQILIYISEHSWRLRTRDQARGWLQSLPLGSITTWHELATKFLAKYFPPAKSAQLKIEISTFRQTDFEQLYEAWERSGIKRTAGVYAVDPITSLTAQVSALTTQLATMNKVSTSNTEGQSFVVEELQVPEEVQYVTNKNFGGYGGYRGKPSFEDLVGTFVSESGKRMSRTESRLDNLETHMASIGATLKILESQVGQITKQLTSQPSSAVQKTADPNLREVNAIFIHHEETCVVGREEKEVELTHVRDEKLSPTTGARGKKSERYGLNQCIDISLLPYPQRFLQLQDEFQKKKGLEDLKNINTNIEFADQVEGEFTKGTRRNVPQKLLDPGEFIVACEIGGHLVEKAICDSGASINIMPRSLYEKLGLSTMRSTELSVLLADKSVKVPLGIVDDVELKIDKLKVLAEFLVLDMENSQDVHVILGRPLLAAVGAMIDVKRGKMTMEVESQLVEIRVSKKSYDPP
ncbi:uncharacterized protein LOC142523831 [Primulina tabacum]|uniref:uncharacterized protein LOC142523831 n=1 Tax=Primulina tabacum TaxID=48773 RepID=UPI003F5968B7